MKNKEGILLFLYKNNRAINNQHIKVIFNGEILINIGSHILLSTENYDINTIFNKLKGLNTGQAIVTGEKYDKLISHCVLNNFQIKDIKHFDEMKEEDKDYINELISELKRPNISLNLKKLFLRELRSELRYIEYEEYNNIYSVTIKSPSGNEVVFSRNNRITFNEMDLDFVKELILLFQEKEYK